MARDPNPLYAVPHQHRPQVALGSRIFQIPSVSIIDEDYWQNPEPIQNQNQNYIHFPYLPDPEEIPAGNLYTSDENEVWQNPQLNYRVKSSQIVSPWQYDEAIPSTIEDDYWQNWQQTSIPLTNYLRNGLLTDPDEIPANTLYGIPDENEIWRNWVSPFALINGPIYLPDPTDDPAGNLYGQPDEDYWINAVIPISNANYIVLPLSDRTEDIFLLFLPEENYWQNWVQPVQANNQIILSLLPDPEEIPAGNLYGTAEEDYWQNPQLNYKVKSSQIVSPWQYDEAISSTIEDDYWQNSVAPIFAQNKVILPLLDFGDEIVPAVITLPVDNDEWQNPLFLVDNYDFILITTGINDEVPFLPEEDYWQNWVVPLTATNFIQLPLNLIIEEISIVPFGGEEEYWNNQVKPVIASNYIQLPLLLDPEEIPAGNLSGQPEEDFWQDPSKNITVRTWSITSPWQYDEAVPSTIEEDYWQNWVVPVGLSNYIQLPLIDPSSEEFIFVPFKGEDEYWQNPVKPVPFTNYIQLPLLPDPEEIPAGKLIGTSEEDYWQNWVRPVSAQSYITLPLLPDPEEIPAHTLRGTAEEDYWQNWTKPVIASNYIQFPILPDPEEIPANKLRGTAEEDYWQNWVTPVQAVNYVKFPLLDPEADIPAGNLFVGRAEEEFWQNWVAPIPATNQIILPLLDFNDDPAATLYGTAEEDYWQNWVWPIQSQNIIILPLLPDPEEIPAGNLYNIPDENEIWRNYVSPTTLTNGSLYLPDPEEISATTLYGIPDENEIWRNYVIPISLTNGLLYLPDPTDNPAGSLYGQPDEDFWQNPVAPISFSNNLQLPPKDPEADNVPPLHGQPDEDYWTNWVTPVIQQNIIILPLLPDPEEIPAGLLYPPPEEVFFFAPIIPPIIQAPVPVWILEDNENWTLFIGSIPACLLISILEPLNVIIAITEQPIVSAAITEPLSINVKIIVCS
jgi:hypothetical protein